MTAPDKDFVIVLLNVLIFVHIGLWIYPVISRSTFSHSFTHEVFIKYLLCAKHCIKPPQNMAVNKTKMPDLKELIF